MNNKVCQLENLKNQPGLVHGFSTSKLGNVSPKFSDDAKANLAKFFELVGVPEDHKSPLFYSHYRSVRTGEPEGRFATVVGIKNNNQ